jgi:hypothetical protein
MGGTEEPGERLLRPGEEPVVVGRAGEERGEPVPPKLGRVPRPLETELSPQAREVYRSLVDALSTFSRDLQR